MREEFSRTRRLIGESAMERLAGACVAVFGIGGVGGHAAEALARCGIGTIHLIDGDTVAMSNINRQAVALHSTLGMPKAEVMRLRILDINPEATVYAHTIYYTSDSADRFDFSKFDYVVDAIDMMSEKVALVVRAHEERVKIISSMGAGNKLDPSRFEVADIYQTTVCPLARIMRRELRSRGIPGLKVVYSKELPACAKEELVDADSMDGGYRKRNAPGSIAFVPSVAGLILAGEAVRDLIATPPPA